MTILYVVFPQDLAPLSDIVSGICWNHSPTLGVTAPIVLLVLGTHWTSSSPSAPVIQCIWPPSDGSPGWDWHLYHSCGLLLPPS